VRTGSSLRGCYSSPPAAAPDSHQASTESGSHQQHRSWLGYRRGPDPASSTTTRRISESCAPGGIVGSIYCAGTIDFIGERSAVAPKHIVARVDHPGVALARAKDTLALVEAVGHPNVRMMLDLYHAQIGEGNLIELIRRCGDAIGEIQIADVPGRCEPGTGEINYPAIARALRGIGYTGTVGLEAWALGDSAAALAAFRSAFAT